VQDNYFHQKKISPDFKLKKKRDSLKEQKSSVIQIKDKMLTNAEIKEICEKHKLTRKEVFDIRSQYTSMNAIQGLGIN